MKEFVIEKDASKAGLGAMLTQEYEIEGEKFLMPVLYASRFLKETKSRFSMTGFRSTWCSLGSENVQVVCYGNKIKGCDRSQCT